MKILWSALLHRATIIKAHIHQSKVMYYTTNNKQTQKLKPGLVAPPTTSGLEMERVYSGLGASLICHSLTYLDTYPLTYSPDTHGASSITTDVSARNVNSGYAGFHFGGYKFN